MFHSHTHTGKQNKNSFYRIHGERSSQVVVSWQVITPAAAQLCCVVCAVPSINVCVVTLYDCSVDGRVPPPSLSVSPVPS